MKLILPLAALLAIALVLGMYFGYKSSRHTAEASESFDSRLDAALKSGRTVFIDCVAEWNIESNTNENLILKTTEVQDAFKKDNVLVLTADWTANDPQITKFLKQFDRTGVPTYVIYPTGAPGEPILLPEPLNKKAVLESLNEAQKNTSKHPSTAN